jgi:uncharacterized membrane protein
MNAMLERLSHAPDSQFARLLFKAAFGSALLAMIFAGAVFFLLGWDYKASYQIVVGLVAAALGAFCAWRYSKLPSHH